MKKFNKTLRFRKWNVNAYLDKYDMVNQNTIVLIDVDCGDIIAECGVCINYKLNHDEIAIKDYSENKGMMKWMYENKLIKDIKCILDNGYVTIPIGILDLDKFE